MADPGAAGAGAATFTPSTAPLRNAYQLGKVIGRGSFGVVLVAERKSDGMKVVIKQIRIKELSEKEREEALNEVKLLAQFHHVNIIQYYECIIEVRFARVAGSV